VPVDASQLDEHIKTIQERRGNGAIHDGSDTQRVQRLALPSPGLMRITGGGIPLGRMTRLWGMPSTGKSLIAWMVIRAAQELSNDRFPNGLESCYWNVEKQYDPIFTGERGVDIDRMKIEEVTVIEDIAAEMQLLMGSCHLHVIDSASMAIARDELASEADQWHRGLDARAWKRAINRIHDAMDKEENILVAIDHAGQDQITGKEHALGGKRMEFKSDMSLHFVKGAWLFYDEWGHLEKNDKLKEKSKNGLGPTGSKEADGIEIRVRCNKSRVCRFGRAATMRLDLHTYKFDRTFELIDAAQFFDAEGGVAMRTKMPAIAEQSGKSAWYELPNGEKVQGARGVRTMIDSDPELAMLIETAMMAGS
jgi:RecA/RadA recombinase